MNLFDPRPNCLCSDNKHHSFDNKHHIYYDEEFGILMTRPICLCSDNKHHIYYDEEFGTLAARLRVTTCATCKAAFFYKNDHLNYIMFDNKSYTPGQWIRVLKQKAFF